MIIGAGVVTFLVTEANFLTQSNLSRGGLLWFPVERNAACHGMLSGVQECSRPGRQSGSMQRWCSASFLLPSH